jgi:signal transduction histidine kinase/PAS domain-containing protein
MISTQLQGRFRAYVQHLIAWHTNPVAQLPRWRHPLVGYLVGLLLVGLGLSVGLVETHLLLPFSFPGVPLLFAIVLVALLWGVGPAVFAMLLSLLVLDYWYVSPFGTLGAYEWSGLLQLLTFASAGIVIALLVNQREVARARALVAEREAALRANQLEATFEAMSDGVVVSTRQGQVLHTNAAALRLFGLGTLPSNDEAHLRQELLLQAVQRDEQGQLLPEKRRPLSRLFAGEVLTGTRVSDVCVQTPDERQAILNMSGAPIKNEAGTIERAVLIFRDVTERRQLEQRTSEALGALLALAEVLIHVPERLRRDEETTPLSDTARVGQRVVELTRSVVESIHVVMLAVEPEEEIMRPLASVGLTPQEEQQWQERLMTAPFLSDHVGSHTLLSHLKDGKVLILKGMTLPFYTAVLPSYVRTVLVAPICIEKRLVGVLCVDDGSRGHTYTSHEMTLIRTIAGLAALILAQAQLQREHTEARANELALREAHRRMEEFLSIICHELKTPLTVMRGSLQLAERKVKRLVSSEALLPDEMRRFAPILALLERARNQVGIQDRLVNDLLDASRIQTQTLQLLMTPCNLVSIVQKAVDDQRQIAPARAIHLETPARKDVPVYGDADRLVQVVTNYLTNALKYSATDRPVEVRLRVEGQIAQVSVRDEGPGLPAAEHERIWECFYRMPGMEVQSGSGGGLGVGLSVCRTIIERHGGQVGVDSRPGEGSTFWFSLPLARHGRMDEETMA